MTFTDEEEDAIREIVLDVLNTAEFELNKPRAVAREALKQERKTRRSARQR